MHKLFDLDSPVMRFLSRVADLMILNILVLIVSIPVITTGAALTAMHYVLIKMVRNEETYITKMFFKSFKENFVQSTIEWIIMIVVGMIFVTDYFVFIRSDKEFSLVFIIAVLVAAVLLFMAGMYVFPLQARFYNKIRNTFKNALLIMILNFPKSVCMLVLYALPVVLLMISSFATPFLIMFGLSVPGLGAVYLYRKVFEKFEPETAKITDDMDFRVEVDEENAEETEGSEEAAGEGSDEASDEEVKTVDGAEVPDMDEDRESGDE